MNRFLLAGVAALCCGSFGTLARGQDSVLAELYGQGVHSYFAGDYTAARQLFTHAIAQGIKDPRCFYFRGLTYHRLGQTTEADSDLKLGAMLEANSTERIYPVSDSLQRVQGRLRLQIEKHRQQARLVSRTRQNQAEQARFQQMERSDQNPTRFPNRAAPAEPPAVMSPDKTDPFASDEGAPEKAPEKPAAVAVEPKPAETDPFDAVTPTAPGQPAPAATAEKPAEAGADPFAVPATEPAKDDASDPFMDDKPATTPPAEAPPVQQPSAEKPAEDPFG